MKEINLEEIFFSEFKKLKEAYPNENYYSEEETKSSVEFIYFISAMREACKQTLELAAEKVSESSCDLEYNSDNNKFQDDILELINQIK